MKTADRRERPLFCEVFMNFQHAYREYGSGEPLLLLHGNGEDGSLFEKQIPAFSPYYRVIVPDTRGHGASPRGEAPFTLSQFADDLLAFVNRLGLPPCRIVGFSDGANIAMHFAVRYPALLRRLVLCGGNYAASGVKPSFQIPIELGYRLLRRIEKKKPELLPKREMLGLMTEDTGLRPEDLVKIRVPTLVMAGDRDLIRRSHTEAIHHLIPGSRLAILRGPHDLMRKNPVAFNRTVLAFLREESLRAAERTPDRSPKTDCAEG